MSIQPQSIARPLIGAIRWDAWHGERGMPGQMMEKTLGVAKHRHRLPFFATALGDRVEIRGDRPGIMEAEIAYAAQAGIDYWAFVTYAPGDSMRIGLEQYLASPRKGEVKFCLIIEQGRWPRLTEGDWLLETLAEPSYLRVLGGRPLLYLGFIKEETTLKQFGSWDRFRASVDELRERVRAAGLGDPYLTIMDFSAAKAADHARRLGADAVSNYAITGGTETGSPFAELREKARQWWSAAQATGMPVIPPVSFGWDPTPRIDTPVPWVKYQKRYHQSPTPAEAAEHLTEALDWTVANPQAAPAQAVLLYAWNENDEGGWLVPTLNSDGSPNEQRLIAVSDAVRSWRR